MLEAEPLAVAHDLHPGYASTAWVERAVAGYGPPESTKALTGLHTFAVQHHHAHLVSCLVENRVEGPALGVTWDGTGYGTDGTIWGGEFLLGDASGFERVAHLRPFRLAGGAAAVREPRRIALALLWELHGEAALELDSLAPIAAIPASTRQILGSMLRRGVNSPITTSAGRLFDGISALLGLHQRVSFEGQAAMALETVAANENTSGYSMPLVPSEMVEDGSAGKAVMILDWRQAVDEVKRDLDRGVEIATISARFHDTLAEAIAEVAATVGVGKVALTGGCFQNRLLTEHTRAALQKRGLDVLLHRDVPPNDGGISLGQIAVAAARLETGKEN
jgi:hydrogenase maturation protein HypF